MTEPAVPSFHDGYLTSIAVGDKCATLGFTRSDGAQFELDLLGVEALQIEDFRQGNIVYELEIVSGRDPASYDNTRALERLFIPPHPSAEACYHEASAAFRARQVEKIKNGEALLVIVSPSYGADLAAYCASVRLRALLPDRLPEGAK